MSASRRFPTSRFQPGIASMYARTGVSPSAFAICGLPPESRPTATFPLLRSFASLTPALPFAPDFVEDLVLVDETNGLFACAEPLASEADDLNFADFFSFSVPDVVRLFIKGLLEFN